MPCPWCGCALKAKMAHHRRGDVVRKRVCEGCGATVMTREAITRPALAQGIGRALAQVEDF